MTACTHRYDDNPDGMVCTRTTEHDPLAKGGHAYSASAGADLSNGTEQGGEGE